MEKSVLMLYRARKLRANMPRCQKIALALVKQITKELRLGTCLSEKVVFCKSNGRWYIVDIYIPKLKLAIEIDGDQHKKQKYYDSCRTLAILVSKGIKVVRFKNKEVVKKSFYKKIRKLLVNSTQV